MAIGQHGRGISSLSYLLLDASSSSGNVELGIMCDADHAVAEKTQGNEMQYLSTVADQRPMLRVAGEIVLAFSCAAPLVLLLSYLI